MSTADERWMRRALALARRGRGRTSPNPMVGAVLVRGQRELGCGWHHGAGLAHAEIEALQHAARRGHTLRGATLYVTLEPCSTHGRTPPCTQAIVSAELRRVVAGAVDPNPAHRGRGFRQLRRAGLETAIGPLTEECTRLNEAFNHWIVHRTPWVQLKLAMTLDGKIADAAGQSRWITGPAARAETHRLRAVVDAILVGIQTVLADDPALTIRAPRIDRPIRRIILDSRARLPLDAQVVTDAARSHTTVVVSARAPADRIRQLAQRVRVWKAPSRQGRIDLDWLMRALGADQVTSLLVEGGGEVSAAFLCERRVHRVFFFYAPKIMGGQGARPAVGGGGAQVLGEALRLREARYRRLGPDLLLTALVGPASAAVTRRA